jgi:hypothetical protein
MKLKDIKATRKDFALVNLKSQYGTAYAFYGLMKWDGERLWKEVHDLYYQNHRWVDTVDVTLDEYNSDKWEVFPKGS